MLLRLAKLPLKVVKKAAEAVRDGGRAQPAPVSPPEPGTPVQVKAETTPNPNSMKFVVSETLVSQGSRSWSAAEDAAGDPLGEALFRIPGVASVFMVNDFVTVTKDPGASWDELTGPVTEAIETHPKPA